MNTATSAELSGSVFQQALNDLWSIVRGLESVGTELLQLYRHKDVALRTANAERLLCLTEQERGLSQRLNTLLRRRYDLIQRSQRAGWPIQSLLQLGQFFYKQGWLLRREWEELEEACRRVADQADRLRRTGWVHWVVARRIERYHRELLQLIGQGGRTEPTYSDAKRSQQSQESGGVLLDHRA